MLFGTWILFMINYSFVWQHLLYLSIGPNLNKSYRNIPVMSTFFMRRQVQFGTYSIKTITLFM